MPMVRASMETPVGRLWLVGSDAGLSAIHFPGSPPAGIPDGTHPVLEAARAQLDEYFTGERRAFDLPLDLLGTEFQRRAWLALADIPYGETRSYGEQARLLGVPRAARAVGAANGRNPVPIVLPCHRVIGAGGDLTGFGGGLAVKRALLEHEAGVLPLALA
jgi:methylated-DNA-[protein]-cysteine S-methyltransferase